MANEGHFDSPSPRALVSVRAWRQPASSSAVNEPLITTQVCPSIFARLQALIDHCALRFACVRSVCVCRLQSVYNSLTHSSCSPGLFGLLTHIVHAFPLTSISRRYCVIAVSLLRHLAFMNLSAYFHIGVLVRWRRPRLTCTPALLHDSARISHAAGAGHEPGDIPRTRTDHSPLSSQPRNTSRSPWCSARLPACTGERTPTSCLRVRRGIPSTGSAAPAGSAFLLE